MTFQISTRNLLKTEIRQSAWMLALSALGHFLFGPVLFLLYTSNYTDWPKERLAKSMTGFFSGTYFLLQLLVMIACITMCIYIYRYLFSKKMVDLYHSVPISRSRLFFVKYLHGFIVWFLPFLLSSLLVALLVSFRLLGSPQLLTVLPAFGKSILLILFCFFIFYHLFLTAVYLSGNILNIFINVGIMGLSVFTIYYLFLANAECYLSTYCYIPSAFSEDLIYGLSPFAAPFGIYVLYNAGTLFTKHVPVLVLCFFVCAALFSIALLLCRKRLSELAEQGTVLKAYCLPARLLLSMIVGIAGSYFFANITTDAQKLVWGIFGALLCSLLCFGATNCIFKTSVKAFFMHKKQMVFVAAAAVLVTVCFQLDLFGYDTYLPRKQDIAGISIKTYNLDDGSSCFMPGSNNTLTYNPIEYTHIARMEMLENADICYDLLQASVHADEENDYHGRYYAKIILKNGNSYERSYHLTNTVYEKLAPFIESDQYKNTYYKFCTGALKAPDELEVILWNRQISSKVSGDDLHKLMEAYHLDFLDHYTLDELSSYLKVGHLYGKYYVDDSSMEYTTFSGDIPLTYTRTLAVLREIHPEYLNAVSSDENIREICLYTPDIYMKWQTLESLYEFFGYGSADNDTGNKTGTDSDLPMAETVSTEQATYTSLAEQLFITDADDIAALYPFLYFGSMTDLFEKREYLHIGNVITQNNLKINCYIKPGTFPKEWIPALYEGLASQK